MSPSLLCLKLFLEISRIKALFLEIIYLLFYFMNVVIPVLKMRKHMNKEVK